MRLAAIGALAGLAALAGIANAGVEVLGSGGAGWVAFPGALNQYDNASRPYWDQRSKDGGTRNIGNYLHGSYTLPLPAGAGASPNITPMWWSHAGAEPLVLGGQASNADLDIGFRSTTPDPVDSTLLLEVAGLAAYNEIGWYDLSDAAGEEVLHPIYAGGAGPLTATSFVPSETWGLYLRSFKDYPGAGQGLLFFSQADRNRANGPAALAADDRRVQHFAIFASGGAPGAERYTIGVEDLPLRSTGIEQFGDYNDVVLTITSVPAPGAAALLALGGLAIARRRRS
ncbi:MAG: hypothetical protein SFY69_07090 [Planctomycetota bacterium]|nr:hypothetical protein [Planctomycetota bacterium]